MKPWEENWEAVEGDVLINGDVQPLTDARAKLAAQAPAMARLLLEIRQWAVNQSGKSTAAPDIWRILSDAGVIE